MKATHYSRDEYRAINCDFLNGAVTDDLSCCRRSLRYVARLDEDVEVCLLLKAGKLAALNVYEMFLVFTHLQPFISHLIHSQEQCI